MTRTPAALLLAASCTPVFAQGYDPVFARIEADRAAWEQHLSEQYKRAQISRWEYERQVQTLQGNIERRRAVRQAELDEIARQRDVQERQTRALEQIANRPAVPATIACESSRLGYSVTTTCRSGAPTMRPVSIANAGDTLIVTA